ncbi:MAG: hypothetical protein KKA64_01970 [Nanoarchaeota archaeon]|nr:hypothetical protein [Nanoarchaeota archaeon]
MVGKRGMESEMMGWWILAIIALAIMIGAYFILKGKGIDAITYVKSLFRFGR